MSRLSKPKPSRVDTMPFLIVGTAAVVVLATGFVLWRAWQNGVWSAGRGEAFGPWHTWHQSRGKLKLVYSAILASNAHNSQPWRFRLAGDTITISADAERHIGSFDPFRREMHLSIGCALENLHQAAHAQGLEVRMELPPGMMALGALPASPAAIVRLGKGKQDETELFRAIPHRHTHRGRYCLDRHVPDELLAEFYAAVPENPSIRLFLFAGSDKEGLANLIVSATKAIVEDRQMSRDNARWFRFAQDAVEQKRDGLTLDANVTAPLQNFAAKIFPPSPESADRHWLQDTEKIQLGTAPLLGMIAVRDLYDRPTALQAGRLWQRLHLLLTARGLAGQPLNQPVERVDRERELDLPHQMAEALAQFTRDAAWLPTFIFRVGYAARPPSVSPRRPVESVVTFARRENSAKADMPTGSVARFHDG